MRATIIVLVLLLIIITGTVACGGANNRRYTVAVTPVAVLPPNEPAATKPATEFAGTNTTRFEYRLVLEPTTVATTATVTQIIKKNDETGGDDDAKYVEQVLTPVDKTGREYWIALPPGMRHIVFYIEGDDNADSFRVFDGDREITFLPRGTFHGKRIVTIEESTLTVANN